MQGGQRLGAGAGAAVGVRGGAGESEGDAVRARKRSVFDTSDDSDGGENADAPRGVATSGSIQPPNHDFLVAELIKRAVVRRPTCDEDVSNGNVLSRQTARLLLKLHVTTELLPPAELQRMVLREMYRTPGSKVTSVGAFVRHCSHNQDSVLQAASQRLFDMWAHRLSIGSPCVGRRCCDDHIVDTTIFTTHAH